MDAKTALREKQFKRMTETPVQKLVAQLSVPTIISMMVTNFYNMVDTAFVGTLGNSASGAIGVVLGFMAILQAVGFMCGQGCGSIMSRSLGNKDLKNATRYVSTGFFMSFFMGLIISLICFVSLDRLVMALGSTETIAPYAKTYISYMLLSAPFFTSSLCMNNILRYEGRAKFGMIGLMTGAILNIAGDAVLIFGFHMGIAGAGISTAVSQVISFVILLYMFLSGKTETKLRISCADFHLRIMGNICATGFPSMLRQGLNSFATILLNSHAAVYGDVAVAAMSIVNRINFFVMAVAIGIGQGYQPVSSFNYGAKRFDRCKKAFWVTAVMAEIILVILIIPVSIYAAPLVRIFRNDDMVVYYAVRALRLQCVTMILMPITMVTEMGFQSTGQRLNATICSSLRSGVVFIPMLLILSRLRGMAGIQEAQPAAFVISFFIFLFFARKYLRDMDRKMEAAGENK